MDEKKNEVERRDLTKDSQSGSQQRFVISEIDGCFAVRTYVMITKKNQSSLLQTERDPMK